MKFAIRYFTKIGNTEKLAKAIGEEKIACRGSFGLIHKNRPNDEDIKSVKEFARNNVK